MMRSGTVVNLAAGLLAAAFLTAFGAWIAVAAHRPDLFMPMTWTAAAMATPAVLGMVFLIVRTAVTIMGWSSTSLIAAGLVIATIVMGPVLALGMVSSALMVVFPARWGIMGSLGQSQMNAVRTRITVG